MMAEAISVLRGGVYGMLLAGEIVSVVGTHSKCSLHLFSFSSSVDKMFPFRSGTGEYAFVLVLTDSLLIL